GAVRLWPATLYGSLKRLIAGGLIEESEERPAPELDDARRRYYKLTRLGKRVLELECRRLEGMVRMAHEKRRQEAY
ncbi:MAG: helix-turn-helix transcriptional regulator, partial [Candidatus Solibacter sp.]